MIAKVIHLALKHKLLVLVLTIGICVSGVVALSKLPIDAFPDISPNLVQIFAEIEGMAPEEVEQIVTRPVEIAMRGIPGVTKIRSLSSLGLSTVNIYFEDNIDIYRVRQLVSERLKHAEEAIPAGVSLPHGLEMGPVASGMGKILAYYLEAEGVDSADLRTIQDWVVKRDIETIPGVAKVISQGGYVRQYEIQIHPDRLLTYNLGIEDIVAAVENNNSNIGAGIIQRGSEELVVRSLGRVHDIPDIENITIKTMHGRPLLIKDVASVTFGKAFRRGVGILNGDREVVMGGIYKIHGANSFETIRLLQERIDQINPTLPKDVRIVPFYDQSELVRNSIRTVRGALGLGLILVCVVAFLFLGNLRNALILVGSLPFSLLFAFILMQRNAIPGDLISFGGVAIALGMIIDATIIMVEKIQTTVNEKGTDSSLMEIITQTGQEVGRPIVFAVFIIVVVFLPILTLGGVEGKMFRPLALTVAMTMLGSLLYAIVVAPVCYGLLHRTVRVQKDTTPTRRFHARSLEYYGGLLERVLKRPGRVTLVISLLMVVGLGLFLNLGREFLPTLQEGTVQCLAYMNPNVSLSQIQETTEQISRDIKAFPEVKDIIADIGYGEVGPHVHHTNFACMTVTLNPKDQWKKTRSQEDLVTQINERIGDYLGVALSYSQPINHEVDGLIAGVGAQVAAKIFGPDMDTLQRLAGDVEHVLADVEGAVDLRIEQVAGQTQIQIQLDSAKLARYGLDKQTVQTLVHHAITGQEVGHVLAGEKAFRILVRFDETSRQDVAAVGAMLIRTPDGIHVPLRELADIETLTGLRQISREDTQRFISVQCNVRNRDVGGFVEEARLRVQEAVTLPAGYRVTWGGQFELQQAANRRLAVVIPLTLFLVAVLLYGLFNSVGNVLLILLNVPLALVGGVLGLALFRENLSIPSSIGFIALFGIALTDGVVLISRFENLRAQGTALCEAVMAGCRSKLRPVLMTTLTTALGLLPLIIATGTGSEIQRPLAVVVVGGLTSSTLLTLFVIPTLYLWINQRVTVAPQQDETGKS
ncbi:efflux RND transporter permease subunit [Planctomycetota bacterium]